MADRLYSDRHPDIRDDVPMKAPDEPKHWIYEKKNITKIDSIFFKDISNDLFFFF